MRKIKDLDIKEYHKHDSISKSRLDLVDQSLLHFLEPPEFKKDYLDFGSALHCLVLEPHLYDDTYKKQPDKIKVRRGKVWDELVEEHPKTHFLKQDMYDNVQRARDNIFKHSIAKAIFTGGESEVSYFADFEINGHKIDVRCRADKFNLGSGIDFKTAASAHPDAFRRSVTNYRYNVQAAFYSDIMEKVEGVPLDGFIFVAVESKPPFAIGVYSMDQESLDCGRTDYEENLQTIIDYRNNPVEVSGYTNNRIDVIGCTDWYFHKRIKGI